MKSIDKKVRKKESIDFIRPNETVFFVSSKVTVLDIDIAARQRPYYERQAGRREKNRR